MTDVPPVPRLPCQMTIGDMDRLLPPQPAWPLLERVKEQLIAERQKIWNIARVITSVYRTDLTQQSVYDAIVLDAQRHPYPATQWAENALYAARRGRPLPWEP